MGDISEVVPAGLDGQRVDRIVALITGASRTEAVALVEGGQVRLDGTVVYVGKLKAHAGQVIEVPADAAGAGAVAPEADSAVDVVVVYEDADVIVIDKPPGLVVHPGAGNTTGTLVNGLLARFPELVGVGGPARPGIVHRLDKGTSGLLVVAHSPIAYAVLAAAMASHAVSRRYLALVWGVPASPAGLIDAPIGRSAREPTRMTVSASGRSARTRYEVREAFTEPEPTALLACDLETGRTHQIRVHLSAIGHPVVGDARYGGNRPEVRAPRPLLHAARLAFAHPVTGESLEFESPVPPDMAAILATLS